jgi:hypothetical protein
MARQSAQLAPLPNSSACTAESHLLLGDFERAEADYRVALEGHPTRVSAWLGLALAQHQQGADHRHALAQVRRVTPVFYRQWQREAGSLHGNSSATPDQLQHAFTMLRGNRGSGLITWWTADGAFHGEHVARATQG